MKRLVIVMSTIVLLMHSCYEVSACNDYGIVSVSQNNGNANSLNEAFTKIAKLPGFHFMSQSEVENMYSKELGKAKSVVYANADPRQKILDILKDIPYKLLYSMSCDENDKIERCYIETTSNDEVQMLYTFIGKGGNDLVVTLFSGKDKSVYQKVGDSLKKFTFEEMEGHIVNCNAECPMVIGPTSEITSMSINRQYWTVRMKVDTKSNNFVGGFEGEQAKEMVKTIVKGFNKKNICTIFNLNVGFKMVITIETGESRTIILEPLDLAEILNDTEITPQHALDVYISNAKNSCPVDMQNGMVMVDTRLDNGILKMEISVDEDKLSIAVMNNNKAAIRQNMMNMIQQEQDLVTVQLAKMLVSTNNGMAYIYTGNKSEKTAEIIISCEELRNLLNK